MHDSDWTPNFGQVGAAPPSWSAKRPLRIAVLGDFGGGALAGRLETGAALGRRKPLPVEFDTLEDALARLKLEPQLPLGAEGATVAVPLGELESFHPDELYRELEVFGALASLRKRLNTPASFAKAAAEVQAWGEDKLRRASSVARRQSARGGALSAGARLDDFARLTGRPGLAAAADDSVDALMRQIVGPFVQPAADPKKDVLVGAVDAALTDAMRAVLHQGDFQHLESLWRGVDFLLRRLETGPQLQVHLIDLSAEEFAADLSQASDLAETGLYKLLVAQPAEHADGGYAYVCACYHFEATPPQAELLGRAAKVASHAGAALLTGIATDPFTNRKEPPHRLVAEAFAALRALPEASFLGLFGPRFLLRHPYGKRSDPISSFSFEEFSPEAGLRGMLWGHPALLALCVLAVRGGQLAVNDLPFHHYVDGDGDSVALPCTDRLINTQAAALLRGFGINGLMAHKGEALVRIAGLEALNGDGLAVALGALRKPPASGGRVGLGSKPEADAPVAVDWQPAMRQGVAMKTGFQTDTSADDLPASTDEAAEAPAEAAPEDAPADGGMDELDALLASLGGDDAAASGEADAAAADAPAEDEMDPELAALLASLG